jgi:O-succinylbenzoate synthase
LVKAVVGEHEGWSESCPLSAPTYLTESAGGVFHHVTKIFGPHVVGRTYDTAEELNKRLSVYKGNSFAKGAIEVAWWTLQSAITTTPLHILLGGTTREVVAGMPLGIEDSVDVLLRKIQDAIDVGFPRIKLKVAHGWDLDVLQAVNSTFPNTTFHIDCNSGYTLDDLPFFRAIDDMGLAFIEQPLHYADIIDHAELARKIQTPICLDESIISVEVARQAIRIGACKYINIKPWRLGGLANCIAVHDMARDAGIPVWLGGMIESGVGKAIGIELATLENFTYPADLGKVGSTFERDLADRPPKMTPGLTFEPSTSGLPFPRPELLEEMTVAHETIVPGS